MALLSVTTPHQEFQPFIDAEVFTAIEVHAAQRITNAVFSTASTTNAAFIDYLSVAIAVWAPVNGHVCIDLENVRQQVRDELGSAREDFDQKLQDELDWPSLAEWHQHLANNPLVFIPEPNNIDHVDHTKPLVLFGNMLYLTRQWADEGIVAIALRTRLTATPTSLPAQATTWVEAVFGKGSANDQAQAVEEDSIDYQAQAVIKALTHNTTVLLGGPGTGKTYTIAGMLHAFYSEHAANNTAGNINPLRVAIAAPTAKAARQVTTSVGLSLALQHFPQTHADLISSVTKTSSTIHRLLGWSPGNRGRFAHHAQNFLPYDIVIIDEVSMVSLPLMARLLEALAPTTKLVLVGDPQQLKSVEAGAVLPDIASLHGDGTYPITKLAKLQQRSAWPISRRSMPTMYLSSLKPEPMKSLSLHCPMLQPTRQSRHRYLRNSIRTFRDTAMPSKTPNWATHKKLLTHLLLFVCCVATVKVLTVFLLGITSLPKPLACLLLAALWVNHYSIPATTFAPA